VLDYKLSHAPDELDAYRAQLLRYRGAVARAQPGEAVRCAFVTGEGRVVEVVELV
jgi:ATP-dependent helicase/nuclease subunit A